MRLARLIVAYLLACASLADCTLNPQPQPPCDPCNAIIARGAGGSDGGSGSTGSGGAGGFTIGIDAGADSAHTTSDAAVAVLPPSAGSDDASNRKEERPEDAGHSDAAEPWDSSARDAANEAGTPVYAVDAPADAVDAGDGTADGLSDVTTEGGE